ncbi:MAG TPA: substrate-binding domain-containing protein [Ilumatobacter sp.]|nr:substrate-binding domain-containing protein [Ilumatobacter sp.]
MTRSTRGLASRWLAAVATLASLSLIAAACGGDDDDDAGTDPPSQATDAPSGGGIDLAALEAELAAAAAVPEFVPQGPAFSVADLAGKKIFSMPVASSLTGCDNMAKWVVEIAKSIGMTDSTYFQNDGGPAAWQEGMEQALNGGYDGVALVCGIDPNALTPQMEAARDAGIPVVDLHLADRSVPADPLIAGQTNGEFNRAMELGVKGALVASGGEPIEVFMITANENPPSVGMEQTVIDTLAELSPESTFQKQNVPIPDWFGGAGQSTIDAALVANPNLDAVILSYDFMAPVVEGSIRANNSSAKIYSFGGDFPVVSTMTAPDTTYGSNMGPDFLWMAYSGADQLFRAMAGEPVIPAAEAYAPYRLWTPANAAEKTEAAGSGFGDAFMQGYYDLWLDHPASAPYQP